MASEPLLVGARVWGKRFPLSSVHLGHRSVSKSGFATSAALHIAAIAADGTARSHVRQPGADLSAARVMDGVPRDILAAREWDQRSSAGGAQQRLCFEGVCAFHLTSHAIRDALPNCRGGRLKDGSDVKGGIRQA